jgi:hypothetical protein
MILLNYARFSFIFVISFFLFLKQPKFEESNQKFEESNQNLAQGNQNQ